MEALLGGLLGGLARLAPEVLKFFDRKNERKHELALGAQQYELVKLQGNNQLQTATVQADAATTVAGLEAVKAAYASMKTGFKSADIINALVRPWITFVVFHAWVLVKVATYVQITKNGLPWEAAVVVLWGPDDKAMLSGISSFFFLGRVFDKKSR